MLTTELTRMADPAETTQLAPAEFALSDDLTLEAAGLDGETPSVFSEPLLDRIRTSD